MAGRRFALVEGDFVQVVAQLLQRHAGSASSRVAAGSKR